jgi:hypothetical protein
MAANATTFPSPTPSLAKVETDLAVLVASQADLKAHKGSRVDRDDRVRVVVSDMSQLRAYVETVVNASPPTDAEAIAGQAAMTIKKKRPYSKPPLATRPLVSGSVVLEAKAEKGAGAYDWQMSTDAGKTWVDLPSTVQARTTVHALTRATTVTFRVRALLRKGPADWGQPVETLVT